MTITAKFAPQSNRRFSPMPLFPRRLAAVVSAALLCTGLFTAPAANAIVGGTAATPPPWLAAIGATLFPRPAGQFCGGILVAPAKVVTAAHCANRFRSLTGLLKVTFGRADLSTDGGETAQVKSIWVDPGFTETKFQGETVEHNDVAVLTLDRPVNRSPLPIDQSGQFPAGASAQVFGWGTTSEHDIDLFSAKLRQATIPLVDDATCAAAYGSSFEQRDMVCAGSPKADTCEFDSGGPLILNGKLVGLTSWALGCARPGFPGVYARLSAFTLPLT
jgi:secreted trypsin-like serine protease